MEFWVGLGKYFVECSSTEIWCCPMIRLRVWVFGRKSTEAKGSSHHVLPGWVPSRDLHGGHWPWSPGSCVSVWSLHCIAVPPRLFSGRRLPCPPCSWGGAAPSPPQDGATENPWTFPQSSFPLLPLFSPLILLLFTDTHLCQFGSVGIYLSFGVEPALLSVFRCSDCSSFDGWDSFIGSCVPLMCPRHCVCVCSVLFFKRIFPFLCCKILQAHFLCVLPLS